MPFKVEDLEDVHNVVMGLCYDIIIANIDFVTSVGINCRC